MTRNPQDIIADHCAALLELVPSDDMIACVLEFARRNLVIDSMLCALLDHVHGFLTGHRRDGRARAAMAALHQLLDLEDPALPVTVAEIGSGDGMPIYRVTNMAGTQLHAWLDRKGWESTGWTLASDFDDIEPVPGREDLPRGAWPVGLAALIGKALAKLDTSEPWGEP